MNAVAVTGSGDMRKVRLDESCPNGPALLFQIGSSTTITLDFQAVHDIVQLYGDMCDAQTRYEHRDG